MSEALKSSIILSMAESLEIEELGAAIRILARLIEKKGDLPVRNIHLSAGVSKDRWEQMKDPILEFFSVSDTHISLNGVFLNIPAAATETKKRARKGTTAPLFPEAAQDHKPEALPSYLAVRPKAITLKQAIYDTGLRLFMANGMTEKIARSVLSSFLNTYPVGDVAEVIEQARTQKDLNDPHSWIVAQLRRKASQSNQAGKAKKLGGGRIHVSNSTNDQMSKDTIARIQERNRTLQTSRVSAPRRSKTET